MSQQNATGATSRGAPYIYRENQQSAMSDEQLVLSET